jgi:hypothetical protein
MRLFEMILPRKKDLLLLVFDGVADFRWKSLDKFIAEHDYSPTCTCPYNVFLPECSLLRHEVYVVWVTFRIVYT